MFERVRTIIVEQLGVDEAAVRPDSRFWDDLTADSLDRIELTMSCEEVFGIEIPDADADQISTVGELVAYLESHVPAST